MTNPEIWTRSTLLAADLGEVEVWASPSVRQRVADTLPYRLGEPGTIPSARLDTVVAIGGGTLLDHAKAIRRDHCLPWKLCAIPSIWGSGAEASPVVVLDQESRKLIRIGAEFLPDVRVRWPELAEGIPVWRARHACADALAHAFECFLSPLAEDELRREVAHLLNRMVELPLTNDPNWFEPSAQAAAAQARASVGLIHGIAHTLEWPLRRMYPDHDWGHAKLVATFLWPVLRFDQATSSKILDLASFFAVDVDAIASVAERLFEEAAYDEALPLLDSHWTAIVRDRCTRTNGALVRPDHRSYFLEKAFQ